MNNAKKNSILSDVNHVIKYYIYVDDVMYNNYNITIT